MSPAQHQRDGGGLHTAQQLGNGQACLHIAADGIQDDQQPPDALVLLDGDQLRDDMLVLGGLVLRGQDIVPLDLANNGQAMDLMPAALGGHAAGVIDLLAAALLLICFRLVLLLIFWGSGCFFLRHGFGSSLWVLPIV